MFYVCVVIVVVTHMCIFTVVVCAVVVVIVSVVARQRIKSRSNMVMWLMVQKHKSEKQVTELFKQLFVKCVCPNGEQMRENRVLAVVVVAGTEVAIVAAAVVVAKGSRSDRRGGRGEETVEPAFLNSPVLFA